MGSVIAAAGLDEGGLESLGCGCSVAFVGAEDFVQRGNALTDRFSGSLLEELGFLQVEERSAGQCNEFGARTDGGLPAFGRGTWLSPVSS